MAMLAFDSFSNILIHSGEWTSKNGNTEVTFSVEGYQTEVMLVLSKLRWKWTGWAVMCEILRKITRRMIILPYTTGMESLQPTDTPEKALQKLKENFNATAGPTNYKDATPKGKSFLQCGGSDQNKPVREPFLLVFSREAKGTGKGSDTHVRFTPAMWTTAQTSAAFGAASGAGPGVKKDEILLHEMVHGMRQMSGTSRCEATPDHPGLDTLEEFMAILISNVYRSELGLTDLRNDHRGFLSMNAELTDPQKFLNHGKGGATSNFQRIMQLKGEHPQLCADLKRVPAAFNPFKLI